MFTFALLTAALIAGVSFLLLKLWGGTRVAAKREDPEWEVLLAKRNEIESDALLDPQTRKSLRDEWAQTADEILARKNSQIAHASSPPLDSRRTGYLIAGLTAAAAVLLYLVVGQYQPDALALNWNKSDPRIGATREPPPPDGAKHPGDNATLEDRIAGLEKRLLDNSADLGGWVLLARSRGIQRDFAGSAEALEKALALVPGHPDLLADLADTVAMTANKSLAGRPSSLIQQVLQADPTHQKGLSLAATAAMQKNDTLLAATYLKRLRATLPSDSPEIAQIDAVLAGFGSTASGSSVLNAARETTSTRPASPAGSASIEGRVELSPQILKQLKQSSLPETAVLFVIARTRGGSPMPVAVTRLSAMQLAKQGNIAFSLDDSSAMSPATQLSSHKSVSLEARVSLTGTAGKQPGDLIGTLSDVPVGARGTTLQIQSVLP